jgi:hypothetical protein
VASIQLFREGPREGHPTHEEGFWVAGAGLCLVSVKARLSPLCFWLWEDEARRKLPLLPLDARAGKRGRCRRVTGSHYLAFLHPCCWLLHSVSDLPLYCDGCNTNTAVSLGYLQIWKHFLDWKQSRVGAQADSYYGYTIGRPLAVLVFVEVARLGESRPQVKAWCCSDDLVLNTGLATWQGQRLSWRRVRRDPGSGR